MLPENELSTVAVISSFAYPVKTPIPADMLQDWELAGVALNDPSQGLQVKVWHCTLEIDRTTGVGSVYIEAPAVAKTLLFSGLGITEVALAFDQNMNPFVAYMQGASAKIYWYDSTVPGMTHTTLPVGCYDLRCTMDEKRLFNIANSDIILSYIRAGNLCIRYQRDRYLVEYVLKAGVGSDAKLVSMALNNGFRIQWRLRNYELTDDPNALIQVHPYLADVVMALCRRTGMKPENINVNELYDALVIGYKCGTDDGINKRIDALREMFFFDKSEADRQIFYPRRGREVVARIPYIDLVSDEPTALKATRIQEFDLPKSVTVNHLDPAGGFANNKQTARRKSNLIKARKEKTIESEVVLTADQGMTSAVTKLKIEWHEQQTFKFATTIKYGFVANADVVEVEDKKGIWHRIRITETNTSRVTIEFEGVQDAGKDVYNTLGIGHSLPTPVSTTPGLIGETLLEILNIPCLRDENDELGVYIGVAGQSSGWYGSQILISTDSGATYLEAARIETPATIGETLTDLEDEVSAEYPADQSFEVLTNFALESVTYEALLNNANRCVIGDELCQFQIATFLGMVGNKYHYRCSRLVRGRYATDVEFWPTGTRFVLLDTSIAFLQAQQWMLGREIFVKPVSFGQTEDETVPTSYDFLEGISQREFPVTNVAATRDGSNNVTVTFIGRGRLGIETAPRNGKYFNGYRVMFSDGHIIDTLNMSATYNSAPIGATVQVCALNTVTGEGPYSAALAT